MDRTKIIIYGIGSLGVKLYEYNKRDKLYDIVGFVDDKEELEPECCGLPTMNYGTFKSVYSPSDCKIFVAIGYVKCNYYREIVSTRVVDDGYELVNYVSPNSVCWDGTIIGKNIFVADNVFVGHGCKLHNGVILYEGCVFSHDTEIESNCFLSLRVAIGGFSKVGHNSFVGLNTTIKDDVLIGAYNIIGCGANVIKSTEDYCVTMGNPGIPKQKDTLSMKI